MSDAWISAGAALLGALTGAAAGLIGAQLKGRSEAHNAVAKEIRDATAELIAKARRPARLEMVYESGEIDDESLKPLVVDWYEEITLAHTKLVVLTGEQDVISAAGWLWQRSTDLVLKLLGRPEAQGYDIESELHDAIRDLQDAVARHHGSGKE